MVVRYRVTLTPEERVDLEGLVRRGKRGARTLTRAHILLLADDGQPDEVIAAALHVGASTVHRTRQRCVEEGVEAALQERPRPGARPKLDGKQEALVIALACSAPPAGRLCWTLQLLAERVVELGVVETISDETIRRTLKKTRCSPGATRGGASRR